MLERVSNTPVMMLETMLLSHISFILGLAIDYISSQCLVLAVALAASTRSWERASLNYRNMPRPAKVAAQVAVVNEVTKPQVYNLTIAGGRRYDATTRDGGAIEGAIVLFREPIPAIIDGERKDINKKWFALTSLVDALIMSENDDTAAKVADVLNGDFMSLRGVTATISVFDGEDGELHYKLEF